MGVLPQDFANVVPLGRPLRSGGSGGSGIVADGQGSRTLCAWQAVLNAWRENSAVVSNSPGKRQGKKQENVTSTYFSNSQSIHYLQDSARGSWQHTVGDDATVNPILVAP